MTESPPKKSDLGVRVASAVVMVAVAGTALWLGGWVWTAFVAVVALGVLWEWWGLVRGFVTSPFGKALWLTGGIVYVGVAAWILVLFRDFGPVLVLQPLLAVIATDIGAYFAGRTFGGPKIAPAISPSKTWSGLLGGVFGASLVIFLLGIDCFSFHGSSLNWSECFAQKLDIWTTLVSLAIGALIAIIAQAGDFFESWMKRRAGVKDSGNLIPGHGGLFDRADGMIAVLFALGLVICLYFGLMVIGIVSPWSP